MYICMYIYIYILQHNRDTVGPCWDNSKLASLRSDVTLAPYVQVSTK